jgi:hypothetical protein
MTLFAAACLLALPALAQAASVNDFIKFDGTTLNDADDANYEYLLKGANNTRTGVIQAGDIIRGAVTISEINTNAINGQGVYWLAVFSIRVRDVLNTEDNVGADGIADTGDIIFEPDPGFQAYLDDLSTILGFTVGGPDLGAVNENVMIRMFQDDTTFDVTTGPTADDAIATYAKGAFYWDLGYDDPDEASHADAGGINGIASDNGEGWVARKADGDLDGTNDPNLLFGAVSGVAVGQEIGTGRFGLSRINASAMGNYFLLPHLLPNVVLNTIGAAGGSTAQFSGFSSVEGAPLAQRNIGFDAKSSSNIQFIAAVPLPGAVWPGFIMLFAVGAMRFRNRRRAA